jgi:uncharacterized membrane protein YfcA
MDFIIAGIAAMAAGAVNALAGGGTLITFPALVALGFPAVQANITNTVALCPGYLGAAGAQFKEIRDQKKRLWILLPPSAIGGVIGGLLLLYTGERTFRELVPLLILLASGLLAIQEPARKWIASRSGRHRQHVVEQWAALPIGIAAIYGGYFGAGLSVIVLSVLGFVMGDSLTRLNAFKQAIALVVNCAAALFFVFTGAVVWTLAAAMAAGAIIGGILGGRLAGRVNPSLLRWVVVATGTVIGIIYMVAL